MSKIHQQLMHRILSCMLGRYQPIIVVEIPSLPLEKTDPEDSPINEVIPPASEVTEVTLLVLGQLAAWNYHHQLAVAVKTPL